MSQDGFLAWISPQRIKPFLGRSPAPTCHPREGGDLPASALGRGGCCSPLVTPDLIRGRLIEPCRSVTLERSDRVHGKSRHRVAVRRPLTRFQCGMCSVGCGMKIRSVKLFSRKIIFLLNNFRDTRTNTTSRKARAGFLNKKCKIVINF